MRWPFVVMSRAEFERRGVLVEALNEDMRALRRENSQLESGYLFALRDLRTSLEQHASVLGVANASLCDRVEDLQDKLPTTVAWATVEALRSVPAAVLVPAGQQPMSLEMADRQRMRELEALRERDRA